jgi:hypothetical protein
MGPRHPPPGRATKGTVVRRVPALLLLDERECAAGVDRVPADASLSSNATAIGAGAETPISMG